MCSTLVFIIYIIAISSDNILTQKVNSETLNNYSEFLNYGSEKLHKLKTSDKENDIIKSKIDVLGEIFKQNIDYLKSSEKLDIVFLIDSSFSVGETNFRSELKFVKKLLSDVTVDLNHTQVAIVTFSSHDKVSKNIDAISVPRAENNKCLLLNKQLSSINYTGGDTYTLGAFQEAKEIFEKSRNDSKKVLFLITDGYSNGGDPVPIAEELKKTHVTIFTIGIQNGNYKELYELASAPGEYHSYLLDSFEEFENLARRALHVDLRSGEYIPLGINSPCDSLCEKGDCCDSKALCSCGTSTGHYSCVCPPGYYGSGFKNSCIACPIGTYSDGPNLCLPCPDINHITNPPALSIKDCKCKRGYQASKEDRCEILKCPKITTPEHAYFVKKRDCGNVLNNACGIRCEVGYTLVGTSIRLCQDNGTWSGDPPTCQIKTCTKLSPPPYGKMVCSHPDLGKVYNHTETNLPVDTVCSFQCTKGRTLVGSHQRTCLPLARWDGLKTSCKRIKCSRLPPVQFGHLEPKSCKTGKQPYGKNCTVVCDKGFELVGPNIKTCNGSHGAWSSKFEDTYCKDVTPPRIKCPKNITIVTEPGQNYGTTSWNVPDVTDNSALEVSVWMTPAVLNMNTYKFQVGETKVTYFAQDGFHNQAKCSFFVIVKDEEPPVIENCINPPTFLTSDRNGTHITWDEPNIYDNSHIVKVERTHEFGFFPMGTTTVTYTATDPSKNKHFCSVNITVEEAHCEALPDPIYGSSQCSPNSDGIQCVITCEEGYAIPITPPEDLSHSASNSSVSFMCKNSESIWYNREGLMFPDCSVTVVPDERIQNGDVIIPIESEICDDNDKLNEVSNAVNHVKENVLNDIDISSKLTNTLFLAINNDLRAVLQQDSCGGKDCSVSTSSSCEDQYEAEEENSNIIKREINTQIEAPHRNKRKRRRMKVKFQIRSKHSRGPTIEPIRIINELQYKGENITLRYKDLEVRCPQGFTPRRDFCVQCPKGTFHNTKSHTCQNCPYGTYADLFGLTECKACPLHQSTKKIHSKSISDCKDECPPGTYARKKIVRSPNRHPKVSIERATLKPFCRSCPLGTYQSEYGQTECEPCPKGYTTKTFGSKNASHCILTSQEICSRSHSVCYNGDCLPDNEYHYACNCFEGFYGTFCEKQISKCDSNPCLNGGTCTILNEVYKNDITCLCPKGFSGKYCEEMEETCPFNCDNNSTCLLDDSDQYMCLCKSGFGGNLCEVKIKYCLDNICENNSTCIEDNGNYKCLCSNGYIGKRCNLLPCDYQPCEEPSTCVNIMEPNAARDSYVCMCSPGYTGNKCSEKIDYCETNPCRNEGQCVNEESSFSCVCSKLYYGSLCENRRDTKYIISFPRRVISDYIRLDNFENDLTEISVCLWIQTTDKFNYGTIFSYATKMFDNAFTVTDYTGLVLYVNNKYVVSDIYLNDGNWHHICIIWKSRDGTYEFFLDGNSVKSGSNLSKDATIQGRGSFVIGQEQDMMGGSFSQSEAFMGKIAYFDVWSKALSKAEVEKHFNDCEDLSFGDIYGWPEVLDKIETNIQILPSSFCTSCNDPMTIKHGIIEVKNGTAYYICDKGYTITSSIYTSGRKCTKASKWEGAYEPYCKRVYCGYPGFIRNGYSFGRSYFYGNRIIFACFEGYDMKGNNTITCQEDSTWYPKKPICRGKQCVAFKIPSQTKYTIVAEHTYEEFIEGKSTFDIGTQIEFSCERVDDILLGEDIITCTENGTWDATPPRCIDKSLNTKATTTTTTTTTTIKTTITSTTISSTSTTTVKPSIGTTDRILISSLTPEKTGRHDCALDQLPNPPINGYIDEASLDELKKGLNNIVYYKCRHGYRLKGNNSTTCIVDGYWTPSNLSCDAVICRKPRPMKNMAINSALSKGTYIFGNMVQFECIEGYQFFGNNAIRCLANGRWTRMQGKCARKSCRKPVVSDKTIVDGNSYLYEDIVTILCPNKKQYILQCNKDGKWEGQTDKSC